jgi:hypothetical protein
MAKELSVPRGHIRWGGCVARFVTYGREFSSAKQMDGVSCTLDLQVTRSVKCMVLRGRDLL